MRLLLVEDNTDVADSVAEFLTLHGCVCDFAYNGEAGEEFALANSYDLYVFDVSMPRMDGLELCRRLRRDHNDQTPVLFLTARDTLDDKLAGFEVGGDDYLVKPFDLPELLVRLKALVKRTISTDRVMMCKGLVVDLNAEQATVNGDPIELSPNNFKLLSTLIQHSPKLVPREQLEHIVWGEELPDSDSLRSHIYKLRKLIDQPGSPSLIQTVKGRGFRMS